MSVNLHTQNIIEDLIFIQFPALAMNFNALINPRLQLGSEFGLLIDEKAQKYA